MSELLPGKSLWTPFRRLIELGREGVNVLLMRHNRRGRPYIQKQIRLDKNYVHSYIVRRDGTIEDLGVTQNLLTNIGRDWWNCQCGFIVGGATTASPATATGATSLTVTGTPLTASNLATPQLGCAGMRVWAPVTGVTTAPVYGNIISNTTSVLTLDKWWKVDDTTGTTPASTNAFQIAPGGVAALRFMALSTNASAASAADTTLASEVTTNGCGRVLALYAHTFGNATCTLSNTFTATGTVTAIHKIGLFTALSSAGADPMVYETVLNADATLVNTDTLAVTWTPTFSG